MISPTLGAGLCRPDQPTYTAKKNRQGLARYGIDRKCANCKYAIVTPRTSVTISGDRKCANQTRLCAHFDHSPCDSKDVPNFILGYIVFVFKSLTSVRHPSYRRNNLTSNGIHIRVSRARLPDHISSHVEELRAKQRDSPGLSSERIDKYLDRLDTPCRRMH